MGELSNQAVIPGHQELLERLIIDPNDPTKPTFDLDGQSIVYRPDYYDRSGMPLKPTSRLVPVEGFDGEHEVLLVKPDTRLILDVTRYCQARCPACINAMYDATMPDTTKGEKTARVLTTQTGSGERRLQLSALAETSDSYFKGVALAGRFAVERAGVQSYSLTGGEPTIIGQKLLHLLEVLPAVNKIKLFTHAGPLGRQRGEASMSYLNELIDRGVSELTISRHHDDEAMNTQYMGKRVPTNDELSAVISRAADRGVKTRFSTLIQRGYIDSTEAMGRFVEFAKKMGVVEVVFRLLANTEATEGQAKDAVGQWTEENRIPFVDIARQMSDIPGLTVSEHKEQHIKSRLYGGTGDLRVVLEQKHDPAELTTDIGVITSFPSFNLLPNGEPEGTLLAYRWVNPQDHAINYRGGDWTKGLPYFRPPASKTP